MVAIKETGVSNQYELTPEMIGKLRSVPSTGTLRIKFTATEKKPLQKKR